MAAHSACAISGGAVTVRRAPPARLRPAGGLWRGARLARRRLARAGLARAAFALASLAGPRRAGLAGPRPGERAPRGRAAGERRNSKGQ